MKDFICSLIGFVGSIIASFFGGWDAAVKTLLMFMIVDYISGLIVAGVFKKSKKTKNGALESNACVKGIIKKVMVLTLVAVAYRLDLLVGSTYIRDTAAIAFIASESISIIENAGLMGLKVPGIISNAVDVLKKNVDEKTKTEGKSE